MHLCTLFKVPWLGSVGFPYHSKMQKIDAGTFPEHAFLCDFWLVYYVFVLFLLLFEKVLLLERLHHYSAWEKWRAETIFKALQNSESGWSIAFSLKFFLDSWLQGVESVNRSQSYFPNAITMLEHPGMYSRVHSAGMTFELFWWVSDLYHYANHELKNVQQC